MENIKLLLKELMQLPQVEAIALGGSRATGTDDENSDYDLYVYLNEPVENFHRREILKKYCRYMEIGNTFWEEEDDVTLVCGIDMDIIYRNLDDFAKGIARVVEECVSSNGYTTCMWHNLITSRILFDRNGRYELLQKTYSVAYPKQLKRNIIQNNLCLLSGMLPSFDKQIAKAQKRGDSVSVNHRVAEFLASYFDIIFALNEMPHPGEKRMQSICSRQCKRLPDHFDDTLNRLFSSMFHHPIDTIIEEMVTRLQTLCKQAAE